MPEGLPATQDAVSRAPVRLALLEDSTLGRILLHSVYVGQELDGERFGNFFSHVLLDVPADFDAGQALRTWGHRFWRRQDEPGPVELPEVSVKQLVPGVDLPFDTKQQGLLQFLLDAHLQAGPGQRIFVLAPAEYLAACLQALTRLLPLGLLRNLTFSTYEYAPLNSPARIVGTWSDKSAGQDLPENCYTGSSIGVNLRTGRKRDLPTRSDYGKWAIKCLVAGKKELESFISECRKLEIASPLLLELAFRVLVAGVVTANGSPLMPEQLQEALAHEPLGKQLLNRPDIIARIVEVAREDARFHCDSFFQRLLALLAESPKMNEVLASVDQASRKFLKEWLFWRTFLTSPTLNGSDLRHLADVLNTSPATARSLYLEQVIAVVGNSLLAPTSDQQCLAVEWLISAQAPVVPGGAAEVYRLLCSYCLQYSGKLSRRPPLALALAAFGSGESSDLAEETADKVQPDLQQLIKTLRVEKKKLLSGLRNAARNWKPESRQRLLPLLRSPLAWLWHWLLIGGIPLLVVLGTLLVADAFTGRLGILARFGLLRSK